MTAAAVNLPPPAATTTTEAHADWLELVALGDSDRQASIEDLISALRTTSSTEELPEERLVDRGSEQAQSLAESAMSLAEERGQAVGKRGNYPFTFEGQALVAARTAVRSTYTYLLLLSKYGEDAGPSDVNGASLLKMWPPSPPSTTSEVIEPGPKFTISASHGGLHQTDSRPRLRTCAASSGKALARGIDPRPVHKRTQSLTSLPGCRCQIREAAR